MSFRIKTSVGAQLKASLETIKNFKPEVCFVFNSENLVVNYGDPGGVFLHFNIKREEVESVGEYVCDTGGTVFIDIRKLIIIIKNNTSADEVELEYNEEVSPDMTVRAYHQSLSEPVEFQISTLINKDEESVIKLDSDMAITRSIASKYLWDQFQNVICFAPDRVLIEMSDDYLKFESCSDTSSFQGMGNKTKMVLRKGDPAYMYHHGEQPNKRAKVSPINGYFSTNFLNWILKPIVLNPNEIKLHYTKKGVLVVEWEISKLGDLIFYILPLEIE